MIKVTRIRVYNPGEVRATKNIETADLVSDLELFRMETKSQHGVEKEILFNYEQSDENSKD